MRFELAHRSSSLVVRHATHMKSPQCKTMLCLKPSKSKLKNKLYKLHKNSFSKAPIKFLLSVSVYPFLFLFFVCEYPFVGVLCLYVVCSPYPSRNLLPSSPPHTNDSLRMQEGQTTLRRMQRCSR